jgi:hypothetical protein
VVAPAGPTAAERAAAREAAARAAAARVAAAARRARQAKLRTQRRRAAQLAAAKKAQRERAERQVSAAARAAAAPVPQNTAVAPPESGIASVTPVLLAGLLAALVLLGVSMTPARAVPWPRAAYALERSREQVALLGGAAFVTIALCLLVLRM